MLVAPAAAGGLFGSNSPKDKSTWGNGRNKGRDGPPLCHHHGLAFLGLLPGATSHRQPVAPPPYQGGDVEATRVTIVSIEVLRGLQEDGYVDYEICATHEQLEPSSDAAAGVLSPYRSGGAAAGWVGPAAAEGTAGAAGGGGAKTSALFTYCRFSKFEKLYTMLRDDLQAGGSVTAHKQTPPRYDS